MKIMENKNLTFDKSPFIAGHLEEVDHFHPETCILYRFERVDDKITLYFKNGTQASIKATNIEGGREIDLIEKKMVNFIENNYRDILSMEI